MAKKALVVDGEGVPCDFTSKRNPDGSVTVQVHESVVTLTPEEWSRTVATMSHAGATDFTLKRALLFHQGPTVERELAASMEQR
jgi:hypothetical protein